MLKSFVCELPKSFTSQEFDALSLLEQSPPTKSKSSSSLHLDSRHKQASMVSAGLSLWQHYRIGFGDVIVIVSLSWLHIINFISPCLVVQLTFTCHLVVVK